MSTAATYEIYYCEAAAGTEWEKKSCAESHGEKKNLMAFPNSSRGKKVSQDTKSEKKKWEGEKRTEMHTHTQMLSSTSCWGWGQCCGECPDSAASSREGWKMESRLGLGERGVKVPGEQYQLQGGRGRKWTLLLILKNQKLDKAISLLIASSSCWHPSHIWARGQHGWLFI